jgi:methylmalonyl-CoA/ethylmalonyl-CoA epimerase
VTGLGLQLHHVGCLVQCIETAAAEYGANQLGAAAGASTWISSQRARVMFVASAPNVYIELVQPDSDNRFLNRLLRRGVTFYHLGYLCGNLKFAELALVANGARELTRFCSEAFEGRQCAFFLTAAGQMIELIETPGLTPSPWN